MGHLQRKNRIKLSVLKWSKTVGKDGKNEVIDFELNSDIF